jgi:putative endonuclease
MPLGRDDTCDASGHNTPMGDRGYFTYLLASAAYGTLYVGVTNDLMARTWEHRNGVVPGFTRKHEIKRLVWFEQHAEIDNAIRREKSIKRWRRDWKISLVEAENPHWEDLYPKLLKAGWFSHR